MKKLRFSLFAILALGASTLPLACSDSGSPTAAGINGNTGSLVVKLTDAPFLTDSLKSVDIFVVRVEGRVTSADSAAADTDLDNGASSGWQLLASPNASFNVLALQNGASLTLGQAPLPAGTYNGFRFIIDPSKSSVTLKGGQTLTGTSSPSVTFPSASRSGIKIDLSQPVTISGGGTTTLLVDFNVNDSFVMRGNSIDKNGLLFKPVIKATVINAATVNATVSLANATNSALDFLQTGTVLSGGSNLAFGASSACASVNAATPALTIRQTGTTTALTGFAPTLQVGTTYSIVAYPTAAGGTQFATLSNTFTPATGQVGFRVFNATATTTGFDVFVTAVGGGLTTPTVLNVLPGVGSTFVSVPAGSDQIRLTSTGSITVLLDLGAQALNAGQKVTLVIAPPAAASTVPRAFLVVGC